jgi:hypothetical protein
VPGGRNPDPDVVEPGRLGVSGGDVAAQPRQAENQDRRRRRRQHRQPRAQHVVGSSTDAEQQQDAGDGEGQHVDGTGQEEQAARALHDLTRWHSYEVQ